MPSTPKKKRSKSPPVNKTQSFIKTTNFKWKMKDKVGEVLNMSGQTSLSPKKKYNPKN
jgi:hypothetical protein